MNYIPNTSCIRLPRVCTFAILLLSLLLTACDNDYVPCEKVLIPITLNIHHEQEWTDTVYYPAGYNARAGVDSPGCRVRYIIKAYPKGAVSGAAYTFSFFSDDLSLADFTYTLKLPMGDWDLYAWQDIVTDGEEPYYSTDNFSAISYIKPYRGDTDHRDCFRGQKNMPVPTTALGAGHLDGGTLTLSRPTGKYVFIATDYNEYLADHGPENLEVTGIYARFMPSVFNNIADLLVRSESGVIYSGRIVPLGNGRAAIAMDYVLMNDRQSGVQVQLAIGGANGNLTAVTDVVTVPLKRGRVTYVEGKFLTSHSSSGINIDFSFNGDINIKI